MTDVKDVITLLCKHLKHCTDANVQPEYFRIAKYNEESPEAVQCFWSILSILGFYAVRKKSHTVNFQDYDKCTSTKLYFAYLQYSGIALYGLPSGDSTNSRELLLALAWLIGIHDVLETAVRYKLIESTMGRESAQTDDAVVQKWTLPEDFEKMETADQMNSIIHKCTKMSHNFKEVAELISEKINLTTKVHAATLNTCGLPHIHVPELAVIKRYVTGGNRYSEEDENILADLQSTGAMLDMHMKWRKNEHVFFNWMVTVLEHHQMNQTTAVSETTRSELSTFISVMRHVTKKRIHGIKNGELSSENFAKIPCASRYSRTHEKDTEIDSWNLQLAGQLNEEEGKLSEGVKELTLELKTMLKAIPNVIQI